MPEIFEVTVRSGEDICKTISDFVTAHGWQNVMIPAAIGSVIGMEFTAPIRDELPLRCAVTPYHAAAELLSFTGEIMKRECADPALLEVYPDKVSPLIVHIHASCATAGGHVAGRQSVPLGADIHDPAGRQPGLSSPFSVIPLS